MNKTKRTLYEIGDDFKALFELFNSMEDADGNPREPNEEETKIIASWFQENEENLKKKFDGYCKFIKNLSYQSDLAAAEKDAYKKELDRLQKRSKAFENRANSVKMCLWDNMRRLGLAKDGYKTALFSAKEQATAGAVSTNTLYDYHNIPEAFLKEPELDKTAIKAGLSDGTLFQKDEKENPLDRGKVFRSLDGKELKGVIFLKGITFIIR